MLTSMDRDAYLKEQLEEKWLSEDIPVRSYTLSEWEVLQDDDYYKIFKPLGWLALIPGFYNPEDGMGDSHGGVLFHHCPDLIKWRARDLTDDEYAEYVQFIIYSADLGLIHISDFPEEGVMDIEDSLVKNMPDQFFLFKKVRRQMVTEGQL